MKPCFGYIRVSSKKQGEGVSLSAQQEAIERFAADHNICIVRWFEEQQTAANSGRPIFNQMLKALRSGHAAGVVMHKIDRSARNFSDWAKIGDLADAGVAIHFATESLDFRSRGGRLAANIQMAVAEDYIRNLKEEVRKGQIGSLKKGLYPFAAPIGYLNNGKAKLKTPDPERAPLIKKAFQLYASGQYSTRTLRYELDRLGLRNALGRPISKGCLEKFLSNPFYTGIIHIRSTGAVYKGAHRPIISAHLFETVQTVKAGRCGKKVTRHNHTYRGLFRCKQCHTSMIPERQKGFVYYRCHTQSCPPNSVREEHLEATILNALQSVRVSDELWVQFTKEFRSWAKKRSLNVDDKPLRLKKAHLEQRKERLTDALIDHIVDQKAYNKRMKALLLEISRLDEQMRVIKQKQENPDYACKFLELAKTLAVQYETAKPAKRREIAEIALSNREVFDKNIYVEPSEWLQAAQLAPSVFSCAQGQATSRRPRQVTEPNFEELVAAATSPESIGAITALIRD